MDKQSVADPARGCSLWRKDRHPLQNVNDRDGTCNGYEEKDHERRLANSIANLVNGTGVA
jgi:hypothetical protein